MKRRDTSKERRERNKDKKPEIKNKQTKQRRNETTLPGNEHKTTTEKQKRRRKRTNPTDRHQRQISRPQAGKAHGTEECACQDVRACAWIALSVRPFSWINNVRFPGLRLPGYDHSGRVRYLPWWRYEAAGKRRRVRWHTIILDVFFFLIRVI